MSGLYKSFPPIPPRPYWRTHEVSTKIANNLLIYKHFLNACHLFTLPLAKTTARPTPSVHPLKPPFPCLPLRNHTSGTLIPAYIYPQIRFSVPSSWRKPLQKLFTATQPSTPSANSRYLQTQPSTYQTPPLTANHKKQAPQPHPKAAGLARLNLILNFIYPSRQHLSLICTKKTAGRKDIFCLQLII